MRLPWAFLKRDLIIATSYRFAFAMQLLSIFIAVPVFSFFGKMFESSGTGPLAAYDGNYFAFLLIGVAFLDYLAISLRTFNQSLRDSQVMGTLEIVLLSPTTLTKLLIYSSLYAYTLTTIRFSLYLFAGLLFGLDLQDANVPAAAAILLLSVVCFASFGILSAGVIMVVKRGDILNVAFSAGSLLLGGVLYPTAMLPEWLQVVAKFLPLTHGLEGMRLALLRGYSTTALLPQFIFLALFAAVMLPISLGVFQLSVRWSKMTGTLSHY